MKKDFKSIAFLAVFTMIVGCAFYCIGFYDSAVFTGIIEDNTIESQKGIIERDKNLIDYLQGHIGFLEDYIKEIKSTKTK